VESYRYCTERRYALPGVQSIFGNEVWNYGSHYYTLSDINLFRTKLTVFFITIAAVIIGFMLLLHQASRSLELELFKKVLTGAMLYVGIFTAIMIAGFWLDFRIWVRSG
jgi:hypothetical protein